MTKINLRLNAIHIKISKRLIVYGLSKKQLAHMQNHFQIKNPKYEEAKRMGRWLQKLSQFLLYAHRKKDRIIIPVGALNEVIDIIKTKFKRKVIIYNNRTSIPIDMGKFKGKLKPYQKKSSTLAREHDFSCICAPTGAGKTVIAIHAILKRKQRTLIVVHTKELMEQWKQRLNAFLYLDNMDLGYIGGGKKERLGDKITIALIQTLKNRIKEYGDEFGHIVVDECHRIPATTFGETINGFKAKYLLGLSATPYRRDKLEKAIFWHLGPIVSDVPSSVLFRNETILTPDFFIQHTSFDSNVPTSQWALLMNDLLKNPKRNLKIVRGIFKEVNDKKRKGNIIVLSERVFQCHIMSQVLLTFSKRMKKPIPEKNVSILTGEVKHEKRQEIVCGMNENTTNRKVIFATGSLIGEGFDCGNISTMFLASPIKYKGRVIQYIGRVLRPDDEKTKPYVYDFIDDFITPLARSGRERIKTYEATYKNAEITTRY